MRQLVPVVIYFTLVLRTISSQSFGSLRANSSPRSSPSVRNDGPPAPPPIPQPPPMSDIGARFSQPPMEEPPFRPPGPPQDGFAMGAMGRGFEMPSSDVSFASYPNSMGYPPPQQDSMSMSQYYPQNQQTSSNNDPYALPYFQSQAPAQNTVPNNGQLMLGGFPYVKPVGRNSFDSFAPPVVVKPPSSPEYSYDWSFNSNANRPPTNNIVVPGIAGAEDEVLTVRDLLATAAPKVMPKPRQSITKRCVPDDISTSSGTCAGRTVRRAKCGGLVSSVSKDCGDDELCCFAIRKNNSILSLSIKQQQRQCISTVAPKNPGFCTSRAERQKNCAGLVASVSVDCLENQLCCFAATANLVEIKIMGAKQRTCHPVVKPAAEGVCTSRQQRAQKCQGMLSSASSACQQDELCCFFLNSTNKQQTSMQAAQNNAYGSESGAYGTPGGNYASGSYYVIPTTTQSTTPTMTRTTTRTTTSSYPPSWNPGASSTPYALPYNPDRLCIPNTNNFIYDGTCVAGTMIQTICNGLQAGTSLNCGYGEYCCYSNKNSTATPGAIGTGCSPDNNPTLNNGVCVGGNDLASKCNGISISTSRVCGILNYCCYSPTGAPPPSPAGQTCTPSTNPSINNGQCVSSSQHGICGGITATSTSCGSGQLCCYSDPNQPATQCSPEADRTITNGTCVGFSSISQQCQGIQISPSLDCGFSQYCCFKQSAVNQGPTYQGCIPDNNPTVTNGTCVDSTQIASRCRGIQISLSGDCPVTSLCCYQNPTPAAPASSTTSSTTTTRPPTTVGVTTTTVQARDPPISSGPVASSPLPGGQNCMPDSNPSVTNGVCVPANQLSSACKGIQIANSRGCPSAYYCCFTATGVATLSPTGSTLPGSPASPSTATATATPSTTSVSGSTSTPPSNVGPVSSAPAPGANTPASTSTYTSPSNIGPVSNTPLPGGTGTTPGSTAPCSPETNPLVTNGRCVDSSQLATVCRGIDIATSRGCPVTSLCCYNRSASAVFSTPSGGTPTLPYSLVTVTTQSTATPAPSTTQTSTATYAYRASGMPYTATPAPTTNRSCSPQSSRQIKNGVCVANGDINNRCKGIQISPSLDCMGDEYCCYQSPDVLDIRPGGACIPQANPKILNGVCVDPDQLSVSCRGVQMSTSRNCKPTQFCCYNTNDAYAWGYGQQSPQQATRQKRPVGSCRPNGLRDDSSLNGICVETGDVMAACKRWQVARSDDCQASQYCCFSDDGQAVQRLQKPVVSQPLRLPNRDTFLLALASQSQGGTDGYGSPSSYSYGSPPASNPAPPSLTPTASTRPPTTSSTSGYITGLTTTGTSTPAPSRSCRPMSYPSISTGICVGDSQVSQACIGIQVSPSLNCFSGELCCFTSSAVTSTTSPKPNCTPDTNTAVTTGQCVDLASIPSVCAGNLMGNSRDCQIGQFCCFGSGTLGTTGITSGTTSSASTPASTTARYTTTSSTATTTTTTKPTITTTTSTAATQTPSTTTSTSTTTQTPSTITTAYSYGNYGNSAASSPSGTGTDMCIPDSMPTLNNGTCVSQSGLSTSCRGIQISTSSQCEIGSYCCFSMVGGQASVANPGGNGGTYQGTGGMTPSPVSAATTLTTPSPPSSQVCNPQSGGASAQQGICVAANSISTACNSLQVSTSLQCGNNEYCCYKPAATVAPAIGSGSQCVPDNAPAVTNGSCVATSQLSKTCAGIELSTSMYCAQDQMCCYSANGVPSSTGNKEAVAKDCVPLSDSTQKGRCVARSRITDTCSSPSIQMSMSRDCGAGEFCCFFRKFVDRSSACSPETNPAITNGFCTDPATIASVCQGSEAATSRDCASDQLCCFQQTAAASRDDTSLDDDSSADSSIRIPSNWPRVLR